MPDCRQWWRRGANWRAGKHNAFRHGRTGRILIRDGWTSPEEFRLSNSLRRTFGVDWPGRNRQTFLPPNVHSAAVLSHMNGGSSASSLVSLPQRFKKTDNAQRPRTESVPEDAPPHVNSPGVRLVMREVYSGNCSSHALIGVNLMKLYGECALSLTQWVEVALEWPRPDVIGQLVGSAYT